MSWKVHACIFLLSIKKVFCKITDITPVSQGVPLLHRLPSLLSHRSTHNDIASSVGLMVLMLPGGGAWGLVDGPVVFIVHVIRPKSIVYKPLPFL
jgi:hypothetical protein